MCMAEVNRGFCRRLERGRGGRIAGGIGDIGGVSGESVGGRLARRFSRCRSARLVRVHVGQSSCMQSDRARLRPVERAGVERE